MTKIQKMSKTEYFIKINVFQGRYSPEEGKLVGYGAIINKLQLPVPYPRILSIISNNRKTYQNDEWKVYSIRYDFADSLKNHLVFALKYEGIDLLFFKKLFEYFPQSEILQLIQSEYSGKNMRKIWFLYEWLMNKELPLPSLKIKEAVPLLNDDIQYAASKVINSPRHRILNNLPGTADFCPLIYKTEKLELFINKDLQKKTNEVIGEISKDILRRTSAFLELKDSKASFNIEGETPTQTKAARWGKAIGQAGKNHLSKDELIRLQQIVIENSKYIKMGFRTEGGFIGIHDVHTSEPIPDHISAKWEDIDQLITGLIEVEKKLNQDFHPILTAAMIAFGFVFIHPFEDGNGRIHRYLIHHILAIMKFSLQGLIFPVSAAILERIDDYRKILESYSEPIQEFIEWKVTKSHNVEVLNDTIDYYRYFDATAQVEFLFECINYTIEKIIPEEVLFLQRYDEMKSYLDDEFQMPDNMVSLLINFLKQNNGKLSKRKNEKVFEKLSEEEVKDIEENYSKIFIGNVEK
ncbi:Fic family protein [soil metagenome]